LLTTYNYYDFVQVIVGGILHFLGGATVGAAVSWFASNILDDYYNKFNHRIDKMVYGEALFVGWVSWLVWNNFPNVDTNFNRT